MDTPSTTPTTPDADRHRLTRRLFFGLPLLAGVFAARPKVAQAGTSTSTWNMEGNNNVDDNDFLGPTIDKPLIFKTKNTERMRITNVGRVGIGTTNPAMTFQVIAINNGITAIRGDTRSTDPRAAGVHGMLTSPTPAATGAGVKGEIAVTGTDNTQNGYGVWGHHQRQGFGVYGSAVGGLGVVGISEIGPDGGGVGVRGTGSTGVIGHGVTLPDDYGATGVFGRSEGVDGKGVFGFYEGEDGYGVLAYANGGLPDRHTERLVAALRADGRGALGIIATTDSEKSIAVSAFAEFATDNTGITGSGQTVGVVGTAPRVGLLGLGGPIDGAPTRDEQLWGREEMQAFESTLGNTPLEGIGVRGVGTSVGVAGSPFTSGGIGVLGIAPVSTAGKANYAVYGKALSADGFAGYFSGKVQVDGVLRVGSGAASQFVMTSAQNVGSYSGNVTLDSSGQATVTLPPGGPNFTDVRYQLTAIGVSAPGLYIAQELSNGAFRIAGGTAGLKVSWRIEGVR